MAKFLDSDGVATLWGKIKSLVSSTDSAWRKAAGVSSTSDLTDLTSKLVTFNAAVTLGNITIPRYAKGMLVGNGTGTGDATLYAIDTDGTIYSVYRNRSTWQNGIRVDAAATRYATTSQSGVVSTSGQAFAGSKFLYDVSGVYFPGSPAFLLLRSASNAVSERLFSLYGGTKKANNKVVGDRFYIRQNSYNSSSGDNVNYYDQYRLPVVTANLTSNNFYEILTSKSAVTVAQGGTGATAAAGARTNLGLNPVNLYSGTYTSGTATLTNAMLYNWLVLIGSDNTVYVSNIYRTSMLTNSKVQVETEDGYISVTMKQSGNNLTMTFSNRTNSNWSIRYVYVFN